MREIITRAVGNVVEVVNVVSVEDLQKLKKIFNYAQYPNLKHMNTFEDLETWQKCREFKKDISVLIKNFPVDEKYRLVDQLKRASRSITANIAERHGRFHYRGNFKFCRNARGSLNEVLDHLICALDELLITENQLHDLRQKYNECYRLLNGYIAFFK